MADAPARSGTLTDEHFARILEFRIALRRFGRFSEEQAARLDMTAPQHQLLLAIRGHDDPRGPTIADVARALLVRHHSAVGLIDRTRDLGLLERRRDADDQRLVRLALTPLGHNRVNALAEAHLKELRRLAEALGALLEVSEPSPDDPPRSERPWTRKAGRSEDRPAPGPAPSD